MNLMRSMRQAILQGGTCFQDFVRGFLQLQYPSGPQDVPGWALDAFRYAGIEIDTRSSWGQQEEKEEKVGRLREPIPAEETKAK
eukprot:CAMPEP_0194711370 /NCGR_PEP_ID=MMETSP0296-20130528/3701_1 /TAXON_ID=39354 /ORGANISM="Heterosigma akashiwo, Strain CCMP2393" /LENGTH=83 /DNA_ID=CAMNT_0039609385 /DNA_START=1 /DNA_END=252 /DNA_ORIENTATION=-